MYSTWLLVLHLIAYKVPYGRILNKACFFFWGMVAGSAGSAEDGSCFSGHLSPVCCRVYATSWKG